MGGRARQSADAAITVLADHGARGLTHRAVDQAAGLPPGTTSNYARTREALLTLTLTRIAELDLAEAAAGVAGSGLADDVAQMVYQWMTEPGRRQRFLRGHTCRHAQENEREAREDCGDMPMVAGHSCLHDASYCRLRANADARSGT